MVNVPFIRLRLGTAGSFHHPGRGSNKDVCRQPGRDRGAIAIEYLTKFGYTRAQAYAILGTAPCQGHISGVVDIPNACATLWLPTDIFAFDVMPGAAGPIKHIKGGIDIPMSPDK